MAIPIQAQPRYGGRDFDSGPLPSISSRDEGFGRPFGGRIPFNDNLSPSAASNPMAIRGVDNSFVPPPLPPPTLVPIDGPVDPSIQKEYRRMDYPCPLGDSFGLSFERRDLSFRRGPDEGYQSIDSVRSSDFPPPFGVRAMGQFRPNDRSIDSSMLSKLDRPGRRPHLSASHNDARPPRPSHAQITTHSLPHRSRQQPFLDTALTRSPGPMSAASPFSRTNPSIMEYRSPIGIDGGDFERSPIPRTQRTNSGSVPDDVTVSSYETRDDETDFPMETSRMRTLNIEDWREREREREREMDYYQAGQKRRASSPPSDDIPLASDGLRRREGGLMSRGSPTPRLTVIPQGTTPSLCSASRSGSYASNLTASSLASVGSFGRRSPNALSPGGLSPTDPSSPYAAPLSATTSPRSALSRSIAMQSPHQRTLSEQAMMGQAARPLASPRKLAEIPKNPSSLVAAKMKGPYMCECCPKKPKKFDTEQELKAHEAEKQYECSFCGNRFKNKNEAERHQNSLHVRRHSWSCSALTGYERAFHDCASRPGEIDICGYCGDEFPRTGLTGPTFISERDWEERIRHLQDVHKFRECNSSKKFYRADHFRQHLKHSHAGTSGKWTNMLENACMIEEDPPLPVR